MLVMMCTKCISAKSVPILTVEPFAVNGKTETSSGLQSSKASNLSLVHFFIDGGCTFECTRYMSLLKYI